MTDTDAALDAHLDATRDERLESYKAFLRIPSISALPEHADDCRRGGRLAGRRADRRPASSTSRSPRPAATRSSTPTGSTPPDAPTVLVYGHYDVQPVDPLDLWTSPPFEPVVVGDRMLARGAADDKGQIHAHVMAAAAAARDPRRAPGQRQYVFEGEEESSSVHLDAWLDGEPRAAGGRRRDHQRHRASSRATCRPSRSACAA